MNKSAWTVEIKNSAVKELHSIDTTYQSKITKAIDDLSDNPRPDGAVKLKQRSKAWRVRVGPYRIIYEIHENHFQILIFRIAHRSDAYREIG